MTDKINSSTDFIEFCLLRLPLLLSDSFRSYKTLRDDIEWNHYMVNHRKNFVNPKKINVTGTDGQLYRRVEVHT